jgi:ParB family transcriptional regulator, chromosome partitioning protein
MTAASNVRKIPLDQLVLSPTNVRKTPPSAAEDAELKASIRARGLKQNLVVHPADDAKDMFAVVAGGRRLKALQKLALEGEIAPDFKVPCLIENPEQAIETSLMENTIRAAMHPADEFVAMAGLIEGGATIDDIATRFGTSERHIRQRLRLGKLAPELLDAFRAGDISLEVVTAFTLGADHAAQLAVWRQVKDNSYIQPYTVKRLLTETAVALDSDLGMFVGAEAYEAAGGTITRDLFSGDEDGFMDDAALVHRLAIEKLEAKAAELRPQWAWTKAALDPEYGFTAQYARVHPQPAEAPPGLAAEIERIESRLGELEEIGGDNWTEELAAEAEQLEERRNEIDETIDGFAVYSDKDRARAGCIVTIGDDGEFCLHQGLIERAALRGATAAGDSESDDDIDATSISSEFGDDEETPSPSVSAEQKLRPGRVSPEISPPPSILRFIRCASICSSASAIAHVRLICGRPRPPPEALSTISPAHRRTVSSKSTAPRSNSTGYRCRRRKVSPRFARCHGTPRKNSSPGALPPASNRNCRSRTGRMR